MDTEADTPSAERSFERRIRPSGNSLVISLPPKILRAAGMGEGDDIEVVADDDGAIVISRDEA